MGQPRESEYRIFYHGGVIYPVVEAVTVNELIPQQKILCIGFQETPVVDQIPVEGINSRYGIRKEPKCKRNFMFIL